MNENWKPIEGLEGLYEISDLGNVKSLSRVVDLGKWKRTTKEKILKPYPDAKGNLIVCLKKENQKIVKTIHYLVALHFLEKPKTDQKLFIFRFIEDLSNNSKDNLFWDTKENQAPKEKLCNICHIIKKTTEFNKYGYQCKECLRNISKLQRMENPEKFRTRELEYNKKNREKRRLAQQQYRINNPLYMIEYKENNRVRFANIEHRYRVRKRNGKIYDFDIELINQRWLYFGNKCWICKKPATATDHVKPLAKGGLHIPSNLRPVCTTCNSKKGPKWPYLEVLDYFNLNTTFLEL